MASQYYKQLFEQKNLLNTFEKGKSVLEGQISSLQKELDQINEKFQSSEKKLLDCNQELISALHENEHVRFFSFKFDFLAILTI